MFGASRLALFAANPVATGASGGYSYFAGGYDGDDPIDANQRTAIIRRYAIATDAVTTISATLQQKLDGVCAAGNGTQGMFAGGGQIDSTGAASTYNSKLDFATEAASVMTVLPAANRYGQGSSSTTTGYHFCGTTSQTSTYSNTTYRYSYSGNSWTTGTSWEYATATGAQTCHANGTKAILLGGISTSSVITNAIRGYTFSSDAVAAESYSLNRGLFIHRGTGNQSKTVILGGLYTTAGAYNEVVEIFQFSSGARTTATNLTVLCGTQDAAGDDYFGIFGGGGHRSGGTSYSEIQRKYTYSSDTYAQSTATYTTRIYSPGACHSIQVS